MPEPCPTLPRIADYRVHGTVDGVTFDCRVTGRKAACDALPILWNFPPLTPESPVASVRFNGGRMTVERIDR